MTELAFFVGKGGVGKTTLSAAYAVRAAAKKRSRRVLLVSTDPAHSLGDVFQIKLGSTARQVRLRAGTYISLWEMDSAKLFADFMRRNKRQILKLAESGTLFSAEEISPLLDTALPGMAEMAALLGILDAIESGKYSNVVVDTAPFGHTLRLLGLPEQFSRLLNFLELAASRDQVLAEHFGGRAATGTAPFVGEWRLNIEKLRQAFSSAELFLVTTPENFAVQESFRVMEELKKLNLLELTAVIMNRTGRGSGRCSHCRSRRRQAAAAMACFRNKFVARYYVGEDAGSPISGVRSLLQFGEHVFGKAPIRERPPAVTSNNGARVRLQRTEWPPLKARLTFVLGKGGVGKTTISAGLGFNTRRTSRNAVEICSVDPAPSLDDIFRSQIGDQPAPVLGDAKFRASEFDAAALFKAWLAEVREEMASATSAEVSGIHVDLAFERRLFSELLEMVPPGLDEVTAIFRIADMRGSSGAKLVIDMAPTGHALELLRTPQRILLWSRLLLKSLATHRKLALVRNAAVKIAELELEARELLNALKSFSQTEAFAVMLPEPLPDRETERLLAQLESLGISCKRIFVNRVIFPGSVRNCQRCRNAEIAQDRLLSKLPRKYPGKDIYVIRNFDCEIAGKAGLRTLTRELWLLK